MLKYRKLPVEIALDQADQTKPGAAKQARDVFMREYFASPAAQVIATVMQRMEADSLKQVRQGERVEYNCGRMSALDDIRESLVALLPDDEATPEDLAPEAEEPYLTSQYESGFNFPLPEEPAPLSGE
jgi:hypothetical protein